MYFKNIIYIYIYIYNVGTWHLVTGYNIVVNNGDQLQTLYGWSMDEGVYVDHIHHPRGM